MLSKPEREILRRGVKRRLLTAEQAEDLAFLNKRFAGKFTLSELILKRAYLSAAQVQDLTETTQAAAVAPTVAASSSSASILSAGDWVDHDDPGATLLGVSGQTMIGQAPIQPPLRSPGVSDSPTDFFEDEDTGPPVERTMIAPVPSFGEDPLDFGGATLFEPDAADQNTPLVSALEPRLEDTIPPTFTPEDPSQTLFDAKPPVLAAEHLKIVPEDPEDFDTPRAPRRPPRPKRQRPGEVVVRPVVVEPQKGPQVIVRSPMPEPRKVVVAPAHEPDLLKDAGAAEALLGNLGPYSLKRVAARGKTSIIYQALRLEDNQEVALKVLALPREQAAARLDQQSQELLKAAALYGPGIVRLLDVGRAAGQHFLASEFVPGFTLEERLESGEELSLETILQLARDLALALYVGKKTGLVHGFVRPEKVLFDPEEKAKLNGFGLGLQPDRVGAGSYYLAPELVAGEATSYLSDQYALGCILYRLLSGQDLAPAQRPQDEDLGTSASPAFRAIVLKLLALAPEERFVDARSLVAELDHLTQEALRARPGKEKGPPSLSWPFLSARAALVATGLGLASLTAVIWGQRSLILPWPLLLSLAGMVGTWASGGLMGVIALIRRGELPLTFSTQVLVRLRDSFGLLGALALLVMPALPWRSLLDQILSFSGALIVLSTCMGMSLRWAVAQARADKGKGRILAVLSDPRLLCWRLLHVMLMAPLCGAAALRFLLQAYFTT